MISFERLGYFGRLGNQMFQYASLIGFAKHSNQSWGIPERNSSDTEIGGLGYKEKFVLNDIFNLTYDTDINPEYKFMENGSLLELPANTDIHGYFQSSKYFSHCTSEIRSQFKFKSEISKKMRKYKKTLEHKDPVSIHVRRGDYLNHSGCFPTLDKEYYENAMSHFPDRKFVFISDDINWCKETFGDTHSYSESGDMYVDLCLMTECYGHIIANSSFSWWGAWLGLGKTIAPKNWFGPEMEYRKDGSIYEEDWILI